jgi:hypothetical protein
VWLDRDTDLMDVTVSVHGVTSTIHATQHHLFWDVTRHAWTEADRLLAGDQLTTGDGTIATVASTVVVAGFGDMWDLTVANTHDFYVTTSVSKMTSSSQIDTIVATDTHPFWVKRVFSVTVDDLHAYYALAGTTLILVHNTSGCGPRITTTYEKAGDLGKYTEGQATRDPASQWYHEYLSNDELLDGVNKADEGDGILVSRDGTILGGHHRWDEIQARVADGRIDPGTPVRIDLYSGE